MLPYWFALAANVTFATASLGYEHYSKKLGSIQVNLFKTGVALIGFFAIAILAQHQLLFDWKIIGLLLLSGLVGLGIGDIFLLKGYVKIGTARTLMLFGFHPLLLAISDFYLFDIPLKNNQWFCLIMMIAALGIFCLENLKSGQWEISGISMGLLCVALDAIGVILTKYCYENSEELNSFTANLYRCIGACVFLGILCTQKRAWKSLSRPDTLKLGFFSILGTFVALLLYLEAVRIGQTSIVSAIAITGPLSAALIQSLMFRKWPSFYLIGGFVFFAIGLLGLL